jgi:hypothetical protein
VGQRPGSEPTLVSFSGFFCPKAPRAPWFCFDVSEQSIFVFDLFWLPSQFSSFTVKYVDSSAVYGHQYNSGRKVLLMSAASAPTQCHRETGIVSLSA